MRVLTLLLGMALVLGLAGGSFLGGVAAAQGPPPPPLPAGGTWQVDDELVTDEHGNPTGAGEDIIVGPLGVANNYEITNSGPAAVQIYVLRDDGTLVEGPSIPKGGTSTVGGEPGDKILGEAEGAGGAEGKYVPE